MFLRNAWYVAAEAGELSHEPLARMICGEPVVLFRTGSGAAAILEDRCCHRRAPLHKGQLVGDTLQCGYHGFRFDAAGTCVEIPGSTVRPPVTARVRSYPVHEAYGYVWLWNGDPERADIAAIPDFSPIADPAWATVSERMPVAAHYQLFVDNLLDLSHVAFVHRSTIGSDDSIAALQLEMRGDNVRLERVALDIPSPPIYVKQGFGPRANQTKVMTFVPPATVVLEITTTELAPPAERDALQKHLFLVNVMTPATAGTMHYFWATNRNFDVANPELDAFFLRETHKAFLEDIDIIEAQQRTIDLDPSKPEVAAAGDIGAIRARKVVQRLLDAEARAAEHAEEQPGIRKRTLQRV
jgi:phenylpropionate dioxygenase-like ring-hydroxylating dioxygenase large terminal subunit